MILLKLSEEHKLQRSLQDWLFYLHLVCNAMYALKLYGMH